ncbi:Mucin 5, subtype B, tracheobronchial [Apodemus speciosus]|uniref:Mucin 5, subtype B, tracheobronchial n=1 Tax=Apodemus speciosus TaxID=105296 RepID=A0ABQ0F0W8_APOSI
METYENIRANGEEICEQPQDIMCMAQNYPGVSVDKLQQKVKCDLSFGLVCYNKDQGGTFPMCYNYLIKVLCCSVSHCQGTATTAGSAPVTGTATITGSSPVTVTATTAGSARVTGTSTTAGSAPVTGPTTTAWSAPVTGTATTAGSAPVTGTSTTAWSAPVTGTATTEGSNFHHCRVIPSDGTYYHCMVGPSDGNCHHCRIIPSDGNCHHCRVSPSDWNSTTAWSASVTGTSTTAESSPVTVTDTTAGSAPVTGPTTTAWSAPETGTATTAGSARVTGTATTAGSAPVTGPTTTAWSAPVTGTATTAGSAPVTGTATTAGSAPVTGPTTTAESAPVTGHTTTAWSAPVTGTAITAGSAPVTGTATTAGSAPVTGTATTAGSAPVTGPTTTAESAPVTGHTTTAWSAPVTGTATTAGSSPVTGTATTAWSTPVTGTATTAGSSPVTGTTTTAGSVPVTVTDTTAGSALVTGTATTAWSTPVTEPTTTAGSAPVTGTATTAQSAPVTGSATTAIQTLSPKPLPNTMTSPHSASTTVATSISKGLTGSRHTTTLVTSYGTSPLHVSSVTETSSPGRVSSIHTTPKILPETLQSTPGLTTQQTSSTGIWTSILTDTSGTISSKSLSTSPELTTGIKDRSTSIPMTSTLPVTMTNATTPQGTTHCQPKCKWTEWFDVDSPTSGVVKGDMETYENIRASGKKMCQAPEKIECRAENYPAVSIDKIGQVVSCNLETGLVCKNEDQTDDFKMCFNYNIRVLCCDDYSHCPNTPYSTTKPSLLWSTQTPLVPFTTSVSSSTESTFQTKHPASSSGPSTQASTWTTSLDSGCAPRCKWTEWFDADFPNPGPRGGDFEVYAVLREVGFIFCDQPKDIQCRSEKEPDRPLETLEQVVQCDVRFGLICKNINQSGPLQYCDNYHVRLLCCDNYSHCTTPPMTTTSTVPSSPHLSSSHTAPALNTTTSFHGLTSSSMPHSSSLVSTHTSAMVTTQTSPITTGPTVAPSTTSGTPHTHEVSPSSQVTFSVSTASSSVFSTPRPTVFSSHTSSPSPCFCQAFGQLFLPGDIIYNKTDGAGCQFYAICNQYCNVDRFQGTCPSSSPPIPSTPAPLSPLLPGCDDAIPPRQVNESWTLENCTVARCQGNNQIILLEPEPVDNVTCVNKHLPIKVWDQEPCHFHYECECFCSGWGHSHYLTFDGTSYSFLDNCTSVLMREIHPRHGNLTILAHSYYCGATANVTSCPRALSVYYNSTEIILTITTTSSGKEESLIIWDQMWIRSGFSKNGVTVSLSGATTMSVNISTIGASITFDGNIFQIWLPYRYFSNNTEGQCGTCTNSQTDDCRRPDGTIASDCQDMARGWLVPGNSSSGCLVQPSPSPSTTPQTPVSSPLTSTPCPSAPLCELMLSQVFAECHQLISPDAFFRTCVSDHCNANITDTLCQSLEAYAALCRAQGVCTNWRNATGGLCDLPCPPTKEYRPCGPLHPASCSPRTQDLSTGMLAEGCFCPENQLLFNSRLDICVSECPCVGPDGLPKFFCNSTTCPKSLPKCEPGYELVQTNENGSCCPSSSCRPKLCTYNDTIYGVGTTFPGGPCQTCTCLSVGDQEPKVECKEMHCSTSCPQGFKYTLVPGQCCGECVQNACLTPEGHVVQPNETWVNSPVDNCTAYHCSAENGVHVLTPIPTSCPDVSNCTGTLRKTGCCYSCEKEDSSTCQVYVNSTILRHKGCETEVNITFCEGSCSGRSKYSMEAQAIEHQCTCCQESKVHDAAVTLQCPDGTVIQHTYTYIDECTCAPGCSSLPGTTMTAS